MESGQEVVLDGAPLEAPQGTTSFTGPAGSLLRLQKVEGHWTLTVDGVLANRYNPSADPTDPPLTWSFGDAHEMRVLSIGKPGQEVYINGVQVPAPDGQTSFTGPGGCLLELLKKGEVWVLSVDGVVVEECHVDAITQSLQTEAAWRYYPSNTGFAHQVLVRNIGRSDQELYIDGNLVAGEKGQMSFTGPGGVLLELRQDGHEWQLFVNGHTLSDFNRLMSASPPPLAPISGPAPPAAAPAASPLPEEQAPKREEPLPAGVSHDQATGKYVANIRVKNRFKYLGEFGTPQAAHEKYVEAKRQLEGK